MSIFSDTFKWEDWLELKERRKAKMSNTVEIEVDFEEVIPFDVIKNDGWSFTFVNIENDKSFVVNPKSWEERKAILDALTTVEEGE